MQAAALRDDRIVEAASFVCECVCALGGEGEGERGDGDANGGDGGLWMRLRRWMEVDGGIRRE